MGKIFLTKRRDERGRLVLDFSDCYPVLAGRVSLVVANDMDVSAASNVAAKEPNTSPVRRSTLMEFLKRSSS